MSQVHTSYRAPTKVGMQAEHTNGGGFLPKGNDLQVQSESVQQKCSIKSAHSEVLDYENMT